MMFALKMALMKFKNQKQKFIILVTDSYSFEQNHDPHLSIDSMIEI